MLHQLWQDSTPGANASAGRKSMQVLKLPPGQLEVLGDGVGITVGIGAGGVGLGVGVPSVVEPIGPNLMSDCDGDVGVAFDGVHRCSIILPSWV